jgi:hypothetical protein
LFPISEIKIKNLDHLGIVAGLIDEIGIVEIINSKLGIEDLLGEGIKTDYINDDKIGKVMDELYLNFPRTIVLNNE